MLIVSCIVNQFSAFCKMPVGILKKAIFHTFPLSVTHTTPNNKKKLLPFENKEIVRLRFGMIDFDNNRQWIFLNEK